VLFCPGAGTSSALGFGAECLDALGVRLIALDRPGLGGSDPDPTRTLASWAEDVRALIAERSLLGPRIVGFSQGAPFALACAAAGLVARAAIVSGGDELASPQMRAALVSDVAVG
jgi:pimeloyl-ACP methyl ester carboxylesterase